MSLADALIWSGLDGDLVRTVKTIALGPPVLLVGPPRQCDQEWLARCVHAETTPDAPFTVAEQARHPLAGSGSVFVDLATVGRVSRAFARSLFGPERRAIVAAGDLRDVARAFENIGSPVTVRLTPLNDRAGEVPRMLDTLLREHGRSVRELPAADLAALVRYDWTGIPELREVARRLVALLEAGSHAGAARRLGMSRAAFSKFINRRFLVGKRMRVMGL